MRRDASLFTIDPSFWDRPATIAALTARDVGALFSLLRKYAGASQTGIGSRVGMAQSEISDISLGKRQVTEFDTYVRIADGLDMPDRARIRLGLAPASASMRDAAPSSSAALMRPVTGKQVGGRVTVDVGYADHGRAPGDGEKEPEEDPMRRRTVLRGLLLGAGIGVSAPALDAIESARGAMDGLLGTTTDPTSVREWERRADEYAGAYQSLPPSKLLGAVVLDFTEVRAHLERRQPAPARARLCHVSARLAGLSGIFLSALGHDRDAHAWLHTGRLAADETGDDKLRAWLTARSSVVSLYYGTPSSALALADDAATVLGRSASPTAVRVAVIRSRALARLGRSDESRRELDRAASLFGRLDRDAGSDKAFGYTERQFYAHVGNALTHLGDTDRAAEYQDKALALYRGTGDQLDPVLTRFDTAARMVRDDDVDEACQVARRALLDVPEEHRTGMVVTYAQGFLRSIPPPRRELPATRDFVDVLATSARTA